MGSGSTQGLNTAAPAAILKDLVAIPSVNPMGRDLAGPECFEENVTRYLCAFFERLGAPYEHIEIAPRRANVIARFENGSRTTVLLDAHQDTVPVDGMTIDPFDPVEKDGRIYGRGACDVKGGMAAMLAAFARLALERPAGAANVIMSCTCDEEATVMGITDLVRTITEPARRRALIPKPPDVAIVAEPTDLDIVVAHRGTSRFKIGTAGRACHSSRPHEGINAIYRMARVLQLVEQYAAELPKRVPAHPLCGPATISVGIISGGISVNTVPDECWIEIDRRILPGEDGIEAREHLAAWLRERVDFELKVESTFGIGLPLSDELNGELAARLMRHIESVAGSRRTIGVPFGTHASRIAAAGIPSVVFGPGSITQAHTKDEWVPVDELRLASEVYYRFCAAF